MTNGTTRMVDSARPTDPAAGPGNGTEPGRDFVRDIVQADLPTLSPLEVQQAVEVLTARTYPLEFVLYHLEAFRAQLSVVPRLSEALEVRH